MSLRKQTSKLTNMLPDLKRIYKKRPVFIYNPINSDKENTRPEITPVYTVFDYNEAGYEERRLPDEKSCCPYKQSGKVTWINVDGIKKSEVERLCAHYDIDHLVIEDILSIGQRAKKDETGKVIYCLLPMLYYNEETAQVETEQVSIVLGHEFVISFQEDATRDVFDPVREKIRTSNTRLREQGEDFLCYSLLDVIVDSYFGVIEKINARIERLEDALLLQKERAPLERISMLRREVMFLRRLIAPVRELVLGFVRSDSRLLKEQNEKYFKDVLDHITQANDYADNQREMMMNMQDLSMSQINLRMNEVMKVFTLLATLMAPATVIGGIFGMNFDVIPLAHHKEGFYLTVSLMLIIPLLMTIWFKRKGWF